MLDALRSSALTLTPTTGPALDPKQIAEDLREYRMKPGAALRALAPGSTQSHEALARILREGNVDAIVAALLALRRMGPDERGALMRGLDLASHEILRHAMRQVQQGAPSAGHPGAVAAPGPRNMTHAATPSFAPATPGTTPGATSARPPAASIDPTSSPSSGATPSKYKPLLDLIARFESKSAGGYDAMNQGGAAGGHRVLGYSGPATAHLGKPLTQMTVQEVMDRQDPSKYPAGGPDDRGIHAAGRYQIIGSTMRELVRQGVVKPTDRFDEATQDKLGAALIEGRRGQGKTGLRNEWIGLTHASNAELDAAMRAAGF